MNKWRKSDIALICNGYFDIVRITDTYIEILSKNTCHSWILQRRQDIAFPSYIIIHHRHKNQKYHHKHGLKRTVREGLEIIKRHDNWVLEF